MPNILVVEDDEKIAATVKLYLEHDGCAVTVAPDGQQALDAFRADRFDLVVLDLMLPKIDGIEVCRTLRRVSDVYIVMLTARTTENDKLRGLDLGADDYVTKPFSPRELAARVRAVLRRGRRTQLPTSVGNLCIDFDRREVRVDDKPVNLTPKEFKLLEVLVGSPEKVFTREELVERAFGFDYDGLDRTIDAHVMNLRKKIDPDRRQPATVVTVFGVGYKFGASEKT